MPSPTAFSWRSFENVSGQSFDASSTTKPYAEDLNKLGEAFEDGSLSVVVTIRGFTTAARDALTAYTGMVIWNTDDVELQVYNSSSWVSVGSGAGSYTFSTSASNPSGAPASVGLWFLNTTDQRLWVSIGTSTQDDWREVLLSGVGP